MWNTLISIHSIQHFIDEGGKIIMFCPNCGFKLQDNFDFCPKCGSKINSSAHQNTHSENVSNNHPSPNQPIQSEKNNEKKLLLGFIVFVIIGYIAIPGILYFNVVSLGVFILGGTYIKKYWDSKKFVKAVIIGLCTIILLGLTNGLKAFHNQAVRNQVMHQYSRHK